MSEKGANESQTSPRSPVGRTDKRKDPGLGGKNLKNNVQNENMGALLKKNFNVEESKTQDVANGNSKLQNNVPMKT